MTRNRKAETLEAHTEGPWFAEGEGSCWRVWHLNGIACIADVHRGVEPDATGEANAKLMAASPELYEACKAALLLLRFAAGKHEDGGVVEVLEKALASASGRAKNP